MNMFPRTAKIKGNCQSFSEHRMQSWAPRFNWIMWKICAQKLKFKWWSHFILPGPGRTPSSTRTEDNRENIRAPLPAQAWKPCQLQLQEIKLVISYLLCIWWSITWEKNCHSIWQNLRILWNVGFRALSTQRLTLKKGEGFLNVN